MLSASRLVAREACVARRACGNVGSEVVAFSRREVREVRRVTSGWRRRSVKSEIRGYAVVKKVVSEEERLRNYQNQTPEQSSLITIETVNEVKPEVDHLRQFLPVVVVEEELAAVEGRVRRAKTGGRVPQAADCLWLILANLKINKLDVALVSWKDLVAQRTPDILHWNLIFAHVAAAGQMTTLSELYENFKLAVIKRQVPGPVPITYNVLLKAFSEQGDLERVLEIYEDFFRNKWIPELYHLHSVVKAAALAGEPKSFHRFLSRLVHKGVKVDRKLLKSLIDSWGRSQLSTDALKKIHLTTGDYAYVLTYMLRVHNYRRAYDLIVECRDNLGIQPDARMYEVVLASFIADGLYREESRALKRRFHKYPKGIEVREEHFEFNALFDKVLSLLGDSASDAKPQASGEKIKFSRTTRKASGRLYSARRPERYESGWVQDELEWVPEYVNRKRELKLAQQQADKAQELQSIIAKAKQQASSL